jgi:hypothetical protein
MKTLRDVPLKHDEKLETRHEKENVNSIID